MVAREAAGFLKDSNIDFLEAVDVIVEADIRAQQVQRRGIGSIRLVDAGVRVIVDGDDTVSRAQEVEEPICSECVAAQESSSLRYPKQRHLAA